jgi:hypothetical protein
VSTISANAELELPPEDDPAPPRLPAAVPPLPEPEEALEDDPPEPAPEAPEELLAPPVEPAETLSPGDTLASEMIVPDAGACSCVLPSAVSAFWRPASAL